MAGNKYLSDSSGQVTEVAATQTSAGAGDAGKIVALDSAGLLAAAMFQSQTATLTNKTLDTAGTGNVFKINGTSITDKTGTGKAVLDTAPTIGGTLTATGLIDISGGSAGQIKFPATQNASADVNTLDDYEEGTFTPGISFGGGTTGITYSVQVGEYIKVGGICFIYLGVSLSSKGSSTGVSNITGLPFTAKNTTNLRPNSFLRINNMTAGTSGAMYGVLVENTSALIPQNYDSVTGVTAGLSDTAYTNSTVHQMTLHYFTG